MGGPQRGHGGLVSAVVGALVAGVPATAATTGDQSLATAARVSSAQLQGLREIVSAGDRAFFVGSTAQHGDEVWTSDGTTEGTTLVKDVRPGSASSASYLTGGRGTALGEVLYFIADDGSWLDARTSPGQGVARPPVSSAWSSRAVGVASSARTTACTSVHAPSSRSRM